MNITDLIIQNIYANWQAEARKEGERSYLGASIIGHDCLRYLWLSFRWAFVPEFGGRMSFAPEFGGRMYRLFNRGHREEPVIEEELRKLGVKLTGAQHEVSAHSGHFKGHFDGVGNFDTCQGADLNGFALLEYKTASDKQWNRLKELGVYQAQPKHFGQMQVYMGLSKLRQAVYISVNKNDDRIYIEIIKYEKAISEGLLAKAGRVIQSREPMERCVEKRTSMKCKYCNAQEVCWGDKAPEVNCRTCRWAQVDMDGKGKWSCTLDGVKELSKARQQAGCPSHQFMHGILPGFAPVCSDEAFVEYNANGTAIRNGAGFTSSSDIKGAWPHLEALEDKQFKKIQEQFNATVDEVALF